MLPVQGSSAGRAGLLLVNADINELGLTARNDSIGAVRENVLASWIVLRSTPR